MSKQTINVGAAANDHTGDFHRPAFIKINDNFDELYVTGYNGYIQGSYLTFDAAGTLGAAAGSMDINGTRYTNAAAITLALSGLTVGLNYVYAKANGSAWAMECSTTAPVLDADLGYFKKTGDATRRAIGQIVALTASTMDQFYCSPDVDDARKVYWGFDSSAYNGGRLFINFPNAWSDWTAYSLTGCLPLTVDAVTIQCSVINYGDDQYTNLYFSPVAQSGSPVPAKAQSSVQGYFPGTTEWLFFQSLRLEGMQSQTIYAALNGGDGVHDQGFQDGSAWVTGYEYRR